MKKMKTLKLMLVTLLAVFGFNGANAAELVGSTQYDTNGFQYVIKSLTKSGDTWSGEVIMKQNTFSGTSITINPTVPITVEGTVASEGDAVCKGSVTFKIVEIAADGFKGLSSVTSITFAEGCNIEVIGEGAFSGTSIADLDLTNTKIETLERLFEKNNVTLKTVKMPQSIKTLAPMALADCIQLNSVDFKTNDCKNLTTLGEGSLSNTVVPTYDFSKCVALTDFSKSEPFVNTTTTTNKNLATVVLPLKDGKCPVTAIGTAFANCEVLATITNLDKSQITAVEDGAFANDIALKILSFPGTLKTVTGAPFAGCKQLATLNFDASALTQLGTTDATAVNYTEAECNTANAAIAGFVAAGTVIADATGMTEANGYSKDYNNDDELLDVDVYLYNTNIGPAKDDADYITTADEKTPASDGQDLFGNYIYDGAEFASPLTTLNIYLPEATPKKSTAVVINKFAFSGNGSEKSALKTLNIADGGVFAGEIVEKAITLSATVNSEITIGDVAAAAKFNTIEGPKGTATATLTIGKYPSATLTHAPIVSGTITTATVGEVSGAGNNILDAIGQAQTIVFDGDIKARISEPATPNAVLTAIEFNGLLGDGATADIIPAKAFDENNAPLLNAVLFQPETEPTAKVFNIKAFGTERKYADAKITLTTTTEIKALYENSEAKLYNIKLFIAEDPKPEATPITVYGNDADGYFYGKFVATTDRLEIAKTNDEGDQVEVYTAFVDTKDQKIYMDRLSLKNGVYVVATGYPFIVRVKAPTTTKPHEKISGGLVAEVKAYATNKYSTMRYVKKSKTVYDILDDLQITDKVFSSDYIGTNYVGKTLYAMANPAKVGTLQFDPVAKTSYLPEGALFVETDENTASAARLEVVWLDGTDDSEATGIINKLIEENNDDAIYNLQGIRVNGAQKGVYIQNGKKFIVK